MNGIVVVDKPAGWTSFDVIAKLRGIFSTRKIGHSGTLDPMATGVLPVFVGPAARAVDLQADHTKEYRAAVRFGLSTDTGDITGTVLQRSDACPAAAEVAAVLPELCGTRSQIPPMYSAVKVGGQPLYRLARQGIVVERRPRTVTIETLQLTRELGPGEFELFMRCGKGTYVRSVIGELGERLGCPAAMSALVRLRSGAYRLEQAHTLEELSAARAAGTLQQLLLDVDTVFAQYPALTADAALQARLENGAASATALADGVFRVYGPQGFLGLAEACGGVLRVKKLFLERE